MASLRTLFLLLVASLVASGCLVDSEPTRTSKAPEPRRVAGTSPPAWSVESLQAATSQPRFAADAILKEDVWHTSWDGVQLHTRVYRPRDPGEWKSPVILHMSPYFGPNSASANPAPSGTGLDGWLVGFFVQRGYAIALNDVRGTGESGGCLEQTGPKQTKDGYKVVEDLAAMPWSNGGVGMIGISYDGETQQSTATAAPPHLTTIVPLASVAGQYEYNYYAGVPYTTTGIGGMVGYTAIGMEPPTVPPQPGARPTNYVERAECHPENVKEGADPKGDFNQYWKDREIRIHVADIKNTSVLYVHGLEDWNVKPVHIRDWYNRIPTEKHAWIGQWQHNFPDGNSFRRDWSRTDWRLTVHRWFDHWLLGLDTGIMAEPAVQVQDSMGRWRFENAWPPVPDSVVTFFLTEDSRLAPAPVDESATAHRAWSDNSVAFDAAAGDARGDAEVWTSEVLAADVHYSGWPELNFTAQLDKDGTHFAAHLIDVAPDGAERIINRAYLDAQHRLTIERSTPVPLNADVSYHLKFFPQDDVIPAGHRLRLRMGSVDGWVQPDGTNARVTLWVGQEKPATLTLPVMDDSSASFFEPLKVDV